MATIKLLSSKDDKAMANFLLTKSGQSLMVMQANTVVPVTPTNYLTKEALYDDIAKNNLQGNLKEKEGEMYDHMVVELGTNADYALKASEIILARFRNPDLQFTKNQGGGRIQIKKVTGEKEVIYDLHTEPNGENHLHILVSRYSIDGKTVNPQDSQKDKYVRQTYLEKINEDLLNAGLKPLSDFTTSITPSNAAMPKASITTQNEAKEVLNAEDTSKAIDKIDYQNVSISESVIEDTLAKAEKDLAQMIEATKKKAEEIKQIRAAQSVLEQNEQLKYKNNSLNEELNNVKLEIESISTEKVNVENRLKEVSNEVNLVRDTFQLPEELPIVEALSDKLQEKENDYQAVIEEKIELETSFKNELQNKAEEIAEKEVFIEALNEEVSSLSNVKLENNLLKSTIEQKDSVISTKDSQLEMEKNYRSEIQSKYEQLENKFTELSNRSEAQDEANRKLLEQNTRMLDTITELKNSNDKLEATQKQQATTINELKETNDKLVADNDNKDRALKVLTDLYTEVKARLSSTTSKLKATLTKLTNGEVKNTVKQVVKDNNDFTNAVNAIEKDTEDKQKMIEALRQKFKDGKAGAKPDDTSNNDNKLGNNPVKPK